MCLSYSALFWSMKRDHGSRFSNSGTGLWPQFTSENGTSLAPLPMTIPLPPDIRGERKVCCGVAKRVTFKHTLLILEENSL